MHKQFLAKHQQAFARLSGDSNPIHVNAEAARRLLFGVPVVHGLHLVLWTLDEAAKSLENNCRLSELRAVFSRPIREGEKAALRLEIDGPAVKATIEGHKGDAAVIRFSLVPVEPPQFCLEAPLPGLTCRELTFDEAADAQGEIPLRLDQNQLERLAPNAARWLPIGQIALVLATTRVVGMECPGLHSLFNSLRLHFEDESMTASSLSYKVTKALERYARLTLEVSSNGMTGELQTSFRPCPQWQASLAKIQESVVPTEFQSQRALVVGGSRGLGEVVAKIVTAGGGSARLSYFMGRRDAETVSQELGGETRAFRLDVVNLEEAELAAIDDGFEISHVYYFASPRILLDQSPAFDKNQFTEYANYYVEGLVRLVRALSARNNKKLRVFYPSTCFIDDPVPGALEYIAAKAAGEAVCRALTDDLDAAFLLRRLPQLATEQTMSILGVDGSDPVSPMLEVVQALNEL